MGSLMQDLKRQASFFLKEKIKTARLVLTDVTPMQLLTEEVTNGDSLAPDAHAMRLISRAAFEVDDYERIVQILHHRLSKFDAWNWRGCYNGVVLLENLLTHGPQRIAEEFQSDRDTIQDMTTFHFVDHKGFNWGLSVKLKAERVMKLLEDRTYLKDERARARKITVGIKGFGSFSQHRKIDDVTSDDENTDRFFRSKSLFFDVQHQHQHQRPDYGLESKLLTSNDDQFSNKMIAQGDDFKGWSHKYKTHEFVMEDDHPFWDKDQNTRISLLSS
ncbi:hypothetical protein ABFS82_06G147300 [Erythranthe guttata]|uniref:ENTH domain-containing protein n=1 Tax=Erythranthe guttata TaxID=4155 RepID=A0A022R0S0_ERYGU|nr:PREDICTED: ENTH domain-containing protein C794.11c-like [Erythranthe guttata]EYU33198.1 hypothetical protein MIMGU_mgv1a011701mg [Erythranthe guttata]|eukprot:XP_012842458.1 PREDICTED: ENTH domain-containing protein C794.11c-like [Erythranthe guttata]